MTTVLRERNAIIKDLLPWDDVNYGTDDQWAWIYPYGQKAKGGQTVECTVKIFNYSEVAKTFRVEPKGPSGFKIDAKDITLTIPPRSEASQVFRVKVPKKATPGVAVLTADIKFDAWDLREWTEAFIEIVP